MDGIGIIENYLQHPRRNVKFIRLYFVGTFKFITFAKSQMI